MGSRLGSIWVPFGDYLGITIAVVFRTYRPRTRLVARLLLTRVVTPTTGRWQKARGEKKKKWGRGMAAALLTAAPTALTKELTDDAWPV